MKNIIYLSVLTAVAINLTACLTQSDILGGNEYLSDKDGALLDCNGQLISTKLKPSDADTFWKKNGLPKGNTDFVCKDFKAYEAKKATDCQGNLIAKHSGGVEGFRSKYNLNNGNMRFVCKGGTVTPVPLSSLQ